MWHPLTGDKVAVLKIVWATIGRMDHLELTRRMIDAYVAEYCHGRHEPWYVPRSPEISVVQSALSEHLAELEYPERFNSDDPRWLETVRAKLDSLVIAPAAFVQHKATSDFLFTMPEHCRVVLIGDWGAQNGFALGVAQQVVAAKPDYTIHLGDIYYSGQPSEAQWFLDNWPRGSQGSFALNGNHERYSGDHAYFGQVLPALHQPASYFALVNSRWQLLATDTAYFDHAWNAAQLQWMKAQFNNAKTILLSHHQPFSAFTADNDEARKLRAETESIKDSLFAWFFGHEHRQTIYAATAATYKARLLGNGAIPALPPMPPSEPCVAYEQMNLARQPGTPYSMCGFAQLDFDGPQLKVRYVNADGSLFAAETWVA